MVPAPRVFQVSSRRLIGLFRGKTLLPRSLRSTAGCQWSYIVAQPGLHTSIACNQGIISSDLLSSSLTCKDIDYESVVTGEFNYEVFNVIRKLLTPVSIKVKVLYTPTDLCGWQFARIFLLILSFIWYYNSCCWASVLLRNNAVLIRIVLLGNDNQII